MIRIFKGRALSGQCGERRQRLRKQRAPHQSGAAEESCVVPERVGTERRRRAKTQWAESIEAERESHGSPTEKKFSLKRKDQRRETCVRNYLFSPLDRVVCGRHKASGPRRRVADQATERLREMMFKEPGGWFHDFLSPARDSNPCY